MIILKIKIMKFVFTAAVLVLVSAMCALNAAQAAPADQWNYKRGGNDWGWECYGEQQSPIDIKS